MEGSSSGVSDFTHPPQRLRLAPVQQRQTLELVPLSYNLWIDASRDRISVSWQEHRGDRRSG